MKATLKAMICAAAAAGILGGAMICAPRAQADEAQSREDLGFCVIEAAEREPEILDLGTEICRVEERLAVGILPEKAENVVTQAAEAEPLQSPAATASPEGKPEGARYLGSYKITGYDICVHCCGKTDGITASGTQATVGRTCAAPPDIPFGTRIWITGIGERVVEDRGGLGTSKIDVLCADHAACYAITTEDKVDVWILEE